MFCEMKTYNNFTEAYHGLLKDVYNTPEHVASPRSMKVKERLGHSFRITNIRDRIPYVPHREFSISYMIAELIWYLSGNNKTEWISNYSAFWKNISDDGVTANSAYGARIFKVHPYQTAGCDDTQCNAGKTLDLVTEGWSQWKYLKDELQKDTDSRRAVLHIRMPQDSYLASKDVPCTLALQFFIRDGALHQVASMRSSDLILGIAYDIPAFTLFQELLANELGVECGSYTHISNSLHIYERHYAMVEKILHDPWLKEFPHRAKPMPSLPQGPLPLDFLNDYEQMFRESTDEATLKHHVNHLVETATSGRCNVYWCDWLLVLAAHRAGKLGLDLYQNEIMSKVTFPGYTLFKK